MSERRQAITEIYGEVPDFLPDDLDEALMGVVRRHKDSQKAAYDLAACARLAEQQAGSGALHRVELLLRQPGVVFVMTSLDRTRFWSEVKSRRIKLWENLTPAICGLAAGEHADRSVVYDRALAIDMLIESTSLPAAESTEENMLMLANKWFVKKIYSCWLGENSPYYLLRI